MMTELDHEAIASVVLLEAHRYVDDAADEAITKLASPPSARSRGGAPAVTASSNLPADMQTTVASAVGELREGTTLSYPPGNEARLTDEELAALAELHLQPAAQSALRKVIRAAASAPLFRLFCLLDAVGDPELTNAGEWLPIDLVRSSGDGQRSMMHDGFYQSFAGYAERRAEKKAK